MMFERIKDPNWWVTPMGETTPMMSPKDAKLLGAGVLAFVSFIGFGAYMSIAGSGEPKSHLECLSQKEREAFQINMQIRQQSGHNINMIGNPKVYAIQECAGFVR